MNDVIKLLKSHRSIRKYSDRPVEQDLVETLIETGQCAATSSFTQACTVIQVNNPAARMKICECAAGQEYVKEAPTPFTGCFETGTL
jgi:nitroreductase